MVNNIGGKVKLSRYAYKSTLKMPLNGINLLIPPPSQTFTMTNNGSSLVQSATIQPQQPQQQTQQQQQQFCLRWTNYHSNLSTVFDQLYQAESFADVTLISEGRSIRAHKMVLAASSPYFQTIFNETPCKHPVVIIKDVRYEELKALVDFMYRGEINVAQEHIRPLLKLAEMFQIRGLTEVSHEEEVLETSQNGGVPVEQFTIYAAFANEEITPQDLKSIDPNAKKRSSKERELSSRKQTLEALDVPVEWPPEDPVNVRIKPPRKRKSQPEVVDENAINNFEPNNAFQNMPSSVVEQPTVMVPPPPPAALIPAIKFEVATPMSSFQQQQQPLPTEEDTTEDTKMSFLDATNEDIPSGHSPDPWNTESSRHSNHSSSANTTTTTAPTAKHQKAAPAWNWSQLQEAIAAVVTQRLRFTQASAKYNIPKGTLYDNILGKSHRMAVLQELPLNPAEEAAVLDFCCDTSISPYNKRTKKSLRSILEFLARFETFRAREDKFSFGGKGGFRWWWAFCRKHSIVSLYFEGMAEDDKEHLVPSRFAAKKSRKSGGVSMTAATVASLAVK